MTVVTSDIIAVRYREMFYTSDLFRVGISAEVSTHAFRLYSNFCITVAEINFNFKISWPRSVLFII